MDPVGIIMMGASFLLLVLAVLIPAIQRRRTKKEEA